MGYGHGYYPARLRSSKEWKDKFVVTTWQEAEKGNAGDVPEYRRGT